MLLFLLHIHMLTTELSAPHYNICVTENTVQTNNLTD